MIKNNRMLNQNGGLSAQINMDKNGMIQAGNPVQQPFSPSSDRTFDMDQQPKQMQPQQQIPQQLNGYILDKLRSQAKARRMGQ